MGRKTDLFGLWCKVLRYAAQPQLFAQVVRLYLFPLRRRAVRVRKPPAPKPKPKLVKPAVADEGAALVTDNDDEEIPDDPVLETLGDDDDDDDDDLIEDVSDLGGTDNVLEGLEGGPEKPDNPATS